MAPIAPQTVASEIIGLLNRAMDSGFVISDIELQKLIRKANQLGEPKSYTCLSAIYSHSLNYELVISNAYKSVKYGSNDSVCVDNALAALHNNILFPEVVKLSKDFPIVLDYSDSVRIAYHAAFHILDFDYCDYIATNYELEFDDESDFSLKLNEKEIFDYKQLKNYFENDEDLIDRAREYLIYAFKCLMDIFKENKIYNKNFTFVINDDVLEPYLELNVMPNNISIDKAIDLEFEWHSAIAKYDVSDRKLCNIAFVLENNE